MMRNENLKNQLNEIPRDFDREKIWAGIELPKKKRKKRGLFWIFGLGMILIGALLWTINPLDNERIESSISENKTSNITEQKSKKSDNIKRAEVEKRATENEEETLDLKKKKETNGSSKSTYPSTTFNQNKEEQQTISNPISAVERIASNGLLNEDNIRSKDWEESDSKETYSVGNQDFRMTGSNGGMKLEVDHTKDHASNTLVEEIPFVELPFYLYCPPDLHMENEVYAYTEKERQSSVFAVSILSMIGGADHGFGTTKFTQNRLEDENPLESISLGILGHWTVSNFDFYSGLSYMRHNTNLTHENQAYAVLNNLNNRVKRVTTTQYSLYNSYQYIDLILGLGYNVHLSRNWSITPAFQIGYTIDASPKGTLFDQFDQSVNISEIEAYQNYGKWQGQANLTIARALNKNWKLGAMVYFNTRKSLASFDDQSHKVYSRGVGLSITRAIR